MKAVQEGLIQIHEPLIQICNFKLTPITLCSFGNVFLADDYDVILNKQMALKEVTFHKIKET